MDNLKGLKKNKKSLKGALVQGLALLTLILATLPARAQQNYVFYNATYGYIYNDNGTPRSGDLRFNKSSVWVASNTLGTSNRTIYSYTNTSQYLRGGNSTNLTTGNSGNASNRWQIRSNHLNYYNQTNGYVRYNNGNLVCGANDNTNTYTPYTVTIEDLAGGWSGFEITGGVSSFNAAGSSTYGHTYASYCDQDYTHYTINNNNNYYVNASNISTTTNPTNTITNAENYTWSLSSNATGYATVNSSGVVTVTSIPTSGKITITLTCTVTYSDHTATATKSIMLTRTGVSGGKVTLDDTEDHSWSYYSDPNCTIRSLNPADVKITYHGKGTGTISTTNGTTPASNSWTQNATTVQVSYNEADSVFIYYKTLERTDGSSSANPTGRCEYTTIPNPFSVRPTYSSGYGTGSNNTFTGFYAWRIKDIKNGKIYDANDSQKTKWTSGNVTTANMLYAEGTYYLQPDDEYGMEVELEALWARAYVSTSGVPSYDVGVERNFYVITASANSNITAGSYPCTYTSIYPNGTTNGTTAATSVTVYKRSTFTAGADSKIEYIRLYNNDNNYITAAGYNLTIGRGVTAYYGDYCAAFVRGMSGGSSSAVDYTIRVESGSFENFYLVTSDRQTYSNTVSTKAIFGCDYDRATNTNNLLSIAPSGSSNHQTGVNAAEGEIYGGTQMICSSASNKDNLTFDWLIKSGTFHEGQLGSASGGDESVYLGSSQSASYNLQYIGKRRMIVEGGDLAGIAGGMNSATANGGSDYNNTTHTTQSSDDYVVIRIKGGNMRSSVYGAAAFAGASGGRKFIFTGGTIAGWIAGGANGTQTDGGTLYGPTNLYIGGNTQVNSNGSTSVINRAVGGNVFGAGCGYGASSNSGQVLTYGTTVVVADNAYIERGIYGGGSYGYTTNTSNIYILGGQVASENGGVSGTSYQASIAGGVFGGACQNQGGTVNITMTDGLVEGGVFGGSNASGNLSGSVTMNISGGTIEGGAFGGGYGTNSVSCNVAGTVGITMTGGTVLSGLYGGGNINSTISNAVTIQINGGQVGTPESNANIHGGGYGPLTAVTGNVTVTLGASTSAPNSATVNGNVYGGSALGQTNTGNATNTTNVTMNKALVNGNVFGGAYGNGAVVNGRITVNVNGGRVNGNVFGGGDAAAYNKSGQNFPVVNMSGGTVTNVFGGGKGNTAIVTGNPQVTLSGNAHVTGNVYGGGDAAQVSGSTNVKVQD